MSREWPRASWHLVLLAGHFDTLIETLTKILPMLVLEGRSLELGVEKALRALLIHLFVSPGKNVIPCPEEMGSRQGQAWSSPPHRLPFSSLDTSCSLGPQGLCTTIVLQMFLPYPHSASYNQLFLILNTLFDYQPKTTSQISQPEGASPFITAGWMITMTRRNCLVLSDPGD